MNTISSLNESVLGELYDTLGEKNVITDREELHILETATFKTKQKVLALLTPENSEHLVDCLFLANKFKVALYPISKGKNWGYGSKVPVQEGSIIVSLHKLNKILDFNENLGCITVEPGVTFTQVQNFLKANKSNLFINAPGSTSEASLIGNTVERGICMGPENERMDQILGMEVLLANGEFVHTGMPFNSKKNLHHRWGLGPNTEGLFTQSNLGIVTKLTLALEPMPAYFQQCFFTLKSLTSLMVNQLQQCLARHTVDTGISIFNDYKILCSQEQYPFHKTDSLPLPNHLKDGMTEGYEYAKWFVQMSISGESMPILNAKKDFLEKELSSIGSIPEFSQINEENPMYSKGHNSTAHSMYWRKKRQPPENPIPERDLCGIIWHGVVVPFENKQILKGIEITKSVVCKYNFEPAISIQCINSRVVYLIVSIFYDREDSNQDNGALKCHKELLQSLEKQAFYPYRLGINGMDQIEKLSKGRVDLIKKLKKMLDPNDILAPGRYDFRHIW